AADAALALRPTGLFAALLRIESAAIRIAAGELDAGARELDAARALLAGCHDPGAVPSRADAVTQRLSTARDDLARPAEPLSRAELLVLMRLPRSTSAIAGDLYLSQNTVKSHLRAIYRKLGVHTRDEAMARARALGLLD